MDRLPIEALRRSPRVAACALVLVLLAASVQAQDHQNIGLGNGHRNSECVLEGANGVLNSTPVGDDVVFGKRVLSGANGICQTPLGGDDVRPPNGVILDYGLPQGPIILAATAGQQDDGVCNDTIVALGDDVVRIPPGQSEPRLLAVGAGANLTLQTVPAGDDVATAVICPGTDAVFQTATDPSDLLVAIHPLCDLCLGSFSCIIPGADDVLQSSVSSQDLEVVYVSSGANGIAESTAAGDDVQVIPPGEGAPGTVCVSAGADGIAQTTICGNGVADLEENAIAADAECDDGNSSSGDGCSSICQPEVICGNGVKQAGEQCDDGNLLAGDGCDSSCKREFCGDGITQPLLGEQCDDGNSRNNDTCVVGCQNAACGDGYLLRNVEQCEPPNTATCDATCLRIYSPECGNGLPDAGEECDDGNQSNRDDCVNSCKLPTCGDGFVKSHGTLPFEACDDGNTAPGDGCSSACAEECGNGVIDGACSEGTVGLHCSADADCDTSLAAGDGRCVGEACDPGLSGLCTIGAEICSNLCEIASCGNGEVECSEECDLGAFNGVAGSGCTALCTRNVVGIDRASECASAWTLDSAPRSLRRSKQGCHDGDSCDFDPIPGQCTFRVGVCLNRPGVAGCSPSDVRSFDIPSLRVNDPQQAAAVEALTTAVRNLSPGTARVPDRCRKGLRGKVCTVPDDRQCDSVFGRQNGICDIGTGVLFDPPLDPTELGGTQESTCTSAVDVTVAVGTTLRLRSRTIWGTDRLRRDDDILRLRCLQ